MIKAYKLNDYQIHGNFIFYKNHGLVFIAPPSSGKSMLSFRLIQKGAKLIADDIIEIYRPNEKTDLSVYGQAPHHAQAYMEIFGLGVIQLPRHKIMQSSPIHHIFIHHDNPPRLLQEKQVCLLDIPIKASPLNFKGPFAADYIDAFCDYHAANLEV